MKRESVSSLKSALSKNLKIAVLYGGSSSERKISLKSGRAVHSALKNLGFKADWLDPSRRDFPKRLRGYDLAFIALHGHGGEDGTLQQKLENARMPYIGSDARSSRLAFDKGLSKQVFQKARIPTAPFLMLSRGAWRSQCKSFPVPFFVKPACEGSSIGIYEVGDFRRDEKKIARSVAAFRRVLIEQKVKGREFTVGVLEGRALPVIELRPKNAFYDYKAKYTKGMTEYVVPAKISSKIAVKLQKTALRTAKALGLRDFCRIDLMVDGKGRPFVLEANSIPGFTEFSLLPKAARCAGIDFEELCFRLVAAACRRAVRQGWLSKNKFAV